MEAPFVRSSVALEETTVRALGIVIGILDVNFNSLLLNQFGNDSDALWFSLAQALVVGSSELSHSMILPVSSHSQVVANTGKHGTVAAKFPFSHKLIAMIGSAEVKSALAQVEVFPMERACCSMFGEQIVAAWSGHGLAYLHDVVALTTPRFPGLTFQQQHSLYQAVVSFVLGGSVTPHGVHVALWQTQHRLDQLCSLISQTKLVDIISELAEHLQQTKTAQDADTASGRLPSLDQIVATVLTQVLWNHVSNAGNTTDFLNFVSHVEKIRPAIELLLGEGAFGLDEMTGASWLGLKTMAVAIEVLQTHKVVKKMLEGAAAEGGHCLDQSLTHDSEDVDGYTYEDYEDLEEGWMDVLFEDDGAVQASASQPTRVVKAQSETMADLLSLCKRWQPSSEFCVSLVTFFDCVKPELVADLIVIYSTQVILCRPGVELLAPHPELPQLLHLFVKFCVNTESVFPGMATPRLNHRRQMLSALMAVTELEVVHDALWNGDSQICDTPIYLHHMLSQQCESQSNQQTAVPMTASDWKTAALGPDQAAVPSDEFYTILARAQASLIAHAKTLLKMKPSFGASDKKGAAGEEASIDIQAISDEQWNIQTVLDTMPPKQYLLQLLYQMGGTSALLHTLSLAPAVTPWLADERLSSIEQRKEMRLLASPYAWLLDRWLVTNEACALDDSKDKRPDTREARDRARYGVLEGSTNENAQSAFLMSRAALAEGAETGEQVQFARILDQLSVDPNGSSCVMPANLQQELVVLMALAQHNQTAGTPIKLDDTDWRGMKMKPHEDSEIEGLADFIAAGCPLLEGSTGSPLIDEAMEQLAVHLSAVAYTARSSWVFGIIADKIPLTEDGGFYLPSMPMSEFGMTRNAMGAVGWYACRNGHPYRSLAPLPTAATCSAAFCVAPLPTAATCSAAYYFVVAMHLTCVLQYW